METDKQNNQSDLAKPLLSKDQKDVLIVMIDHHLGNTVVSLPVIHKLLTYFEQTPDVAVDQRFVPLVKMLDSCNQVYAYPSLYPKRRGIIRNIKPMAVNALLASKRYKTVIDITSTKRAALLSKFTFAKNRIGFSASRLSKLYTHRVEHGEKIHKFDLYSDILKIIDCPSPPEKVMLKPSPQAVDSITSLLKTNQPNYGNKIAVMHPCAGDDLRRWPEQRFAAVADYIIERYGMDICIIATPLEKHIKEKVVENINRKQSVFDMSLSLEQLAALFYKSQLIVSNESGPTHLAAATDLPIVTIFGPANEARWRPIRDENITILRGADCDPDCGHGKCVAQRRCILNLEVQTVFSAVDDMIAQRENSN